MNVSVNTPYPGTETWATEGRKLATRDYRLFDIQHAVLPTKLPLPEFYAELVRTQQVLNRKHLGEKQLWGTARTVARLLAHGQTNFLKMLFKFNSVYDPKLQMADHARPVRYEMSLPRSRGPRSTRTRSTSTRARVVAAARSTTSPSGSSRTRAWEWPIDGTRRVRPMIRVRAWAVALACVVAICAVGQGWRGR